MSKDIKQPNRFRLSLGYVFLAIITLFDPTTAREMFTAWGLTKRKESKIKKAETLSSEKGASRE